MGQVGQSESDKNNHQQILEKCLKFLMLNQSSQTERDSIKSLKPWLNFLSVLGPKQLSTWWMEKERGSPKSLWRKTTWDDFRWMRRRRVSVVLLSTDVLTKRKPADSCCSMLFLYYMGFLHFFIKSWPTTKLLLRQKRFQTSWKNCLCHRLALWVLVTQYAFGCSVWFPRESTQQ